ncbi:MAG: disulfide bond formation protein B [Arenicellales bacterium]|jgi:disulfide bond formation protein DsbB|nr:disulfide bond formation protein B [Acidiferrobacteraceae bacterium]MDP6392060.1 disulfide bond formation protein B [Arenicellales bacterium]|tara:strand:- start:24 stop:551 length:528 start_codon:yes stop_codon:yes gene_type:complete
MMFDSNTITASFWYWFALFIFGILLEAVALVYQYWLDYLPCVLCIHTRMLVFAALVVSALMLWGRSIRMFRLGAHLLLIVIWAALTERSWQLLATERRWSIGECSMDSSLPGWIPLERMMPWLFRIEEPCGYTPEMLFGVTMAEALIILAPSMTLAMAVMLIRSETLKRQSPSRE